MADEKEETPKEKAAAAAAIPIPSKLSKEHVDLINKELERLHKLLLEKEAKDMDWVKEQIEIFHKTILSKPTNSK